VTRARSKGVPRGRSGRTRSSRGFLPQSRYLSPRKGPSQHRLRSWGPASLNSGINPANFRPAFHPGLPDQGPLALWTFNGTLPPKLLVGRYGEGIIFRHSNKLPFDITQNGGFGSIP